MNEFSFKELYDVTLKITSNIEVNGRTLLPNETIAAFDKIQISNFREIVASTTAHGGYGDYDRVWWESPREIDLTFSQGIFSATQLAVMTNSRLINIQENDSIYINKREVVTVNNEGIITFNEEPHDYLFIYNTSTGEKLNYVIVDSLHVMISEDLNEVLVDYAIKYDNGAKILRVGNPLINGFLNFEGKTRVKDDITGLVKTGILYIPKLKLMSDLSMQLGTDARPYTGVLRAVGCPFGTRGNLRVMEIKFLNDDIDSDI